MKETSSPAPNRIRSREGLLRLLHDNPAAVSRAEIKAAFADGRLGEQDMDIPVLAGMRRITELLSELDHGPETAAAPEATTPPAPRITPTGTRLTELEAQVAGLMTRLDAAVHDAADARQTADAAQRSADAVQQALEQLRRATDDDRGAATAAARTLQLLAAGLAVVAALAVIALILGFATR